MKNFALIGAAGFVAPRHLKAIKATGNQLVAAVDPKDSVGILDSYFPETAFFTEFERFDRHLEKLKRQGLGVDYVSVCSPNYLHDAHVRFGLRYGAQVICEKPLVLNPWNLDTLRDIEKETGSKVWNILQLRLHPALLLLKHNIEHNASIGGCHDVELTYITSRGHWYYSSWKGEMSKSGGIATNIGIHFFDMLIWLFGPVQELMVHLHTHDRAAGVLVLKKAKVRWFLSINAETLPAEAVEKRTFRSIKVDGHEIEFSDGFTDLHTLSYEGILAGTGFSLDEAAPGIQLAHDIRHAAPTPPDEQAHPLVHLPLSGHPFAVSR